MRLAVVVPRHNFHETGLHGENFIPTVIPQEVGREDPVLTVRHFGPEMSKKPWRGSFATRLAVWNFGGIKIKTRLND